MAKKNDSLGDRMKGYESVSRNFLTHRVPAIIRLDGKAFHTFTKGMEKTFRPRTNSGYAGDDEVSL
jgi:tRNA(His) guanylyltransferase